ncbi:hypothetical protein [Cuniculiplasma divulgatum]|nr:hypothetical protein [Cuniculiplasma divulgatum]
MDMEFTDRRFKSYNNPKREVETWMEKLHRDKNGIECKFNRER